MTSRVQSSAAASETNPTPATCYRVEHRPGTQKPFKLEIQASNGAKLIASGKLHQHPSLLTEVVDPPLVARRKTSLRLTWKLDHL